MLALICSATCVLMAGVSPATAGAAGNFDMRGEWSVAASATHEPTTSGVCVIATMELSSGAFSGTCKFDGGAFPGTISGTTTSTSASVTITIEGVGISFTAPSATIQTTSSPPSLSGAGTYSGGGFTGETGSLSMTRTATYEEVQAREARELKEREEKEAKEREAKEKEARELKERQEAEAKAQEAREAKERQETETRAREAREAKERLEREAREVAAKQAVSVPVLTLVAVEPAVKAVAENRSGSISVKLSSPNAVAVSGHFTLTGTTSAGKGAGKHTVKLGGATFALAAYGSESVKLKLSSSAIALLKHHAKLAATLTLVTEANGATSVTKAYSVVLSAPRGRKGKG
jgi:hypothetical protein